MNVAVLGASDKPDRFSYKAVMLLKDKGHQVFPVHQRVKTIEGMNVFPSLKEIKSPVDTLSLYVSADISSKLTTEILEKSPRRIIFNPGAENPELEQQARRHGIQTVNNCTLVMLRSGAF